MRGRRTMNTVWWIVGTVILIGLVVWAVVRILNTPLPAETDDTSNASIDTSLQRPVTYF